MVFPTHAVSPPPTASHAGSNIEQARWFAQEVHPHEPQLKAYLRGSFPSVRDVDDLVQQSYLQVWRRHLAAPVRSAKSFLYKVARHLAIDSVRHIARSPVESVADLPALAVLDSSRDAAETACTNEELEMLLEAIDALPARCREILILRKLRGLSQKEIAFRMGITERTVEVQGTKGLKRCEEYLARRGVIRRSCR